jgi:hypothetical protein
LIRWLFSGIATVSLAVNGLLYWQSDAFPKNLPTGNAGWVEAYLHLFSDPFAAGCILLFTVALTVATMCITELLLGLIFSIVAAAATLFCLVGQLATHYPPLAHMLLRLLPS